MFIAHLMCCMIGNTVSPDPRHGHESVMVNNKLLVWGGQDDTRKMLSRCECFTVEPKNCRD